MWDIEKDLADTATSVKTKKPLSERYIFIRKIMTQLKIDHPKIHHKDRFKIVKKIWKEQLNKL